MRGLIRAAVVALFVCVYSLQCIPLAGAQTVNLNRWDQPHRANPFIPGYYADASILQKNDETFVYATLDPWGDRTLGCWRSKDFANWQSCNLNWPTKEAATSPTSGDSMVWAPSVVQGRNGHYYMYVSVGSEVWVGTADQPTGPWRNALGAKPLIDHNYRPGFHMIDAEVFQDEDGQAYLYWGSGLHWVNGHCFVVKLKADMVSFDGEPKDVTPGHYFEGPFLYKHDGRYYLTYSEGNTTDDSYNIRYAVSNSPMGPFLEGKNSPMLVSDREKQILGPGHHAIFNRNGKTYILYHRHSLPFDSTLVKRQLCMDELKFTPDGEIASVIPTHDGPALLHQAVRDAGRLAATASASSASAPIHAAQYAIDDNYATRWTAAADDKAPWLMLDLGKAVEVVHADLRFEYAWKAHRFRVEGSIDGSHWIQLADQSKADVLGSPIRVEIGQKMQFLRLVPAEGAKLDSSVIEWSAFAR